MFFPDRKKVATIILAKHSPEGDHSMPIAPEETVGDHDEDFKSACEDIMQAIHEKSPHDLMLALKAALEIHDAHEATESPEEESAEHAAE
jgi:hypothetical protein